MKKIVCLKPFKLLFTFLTLLFLHVSAVAQDVDVDITTENTAGWFERNWMWVAGAVLLIILIAAFSGGGRSRTTTTEVRDEYGNVKRVSSTTEVED